MASVSHPPETYHEWVQCMDAVRRDDDVEAVILLMERGRLEWSSGVAERFAGRLGELIEERLREATDQLQSDLHRFAGKELETVQAMLAMRRKCTVILKLASLPVLPDEAGLQVREMVLRSFRNIQVSLEESAKRDRTGQLARLVRNTPLSPEKAGEQQPAPVREETGMPAGRRVLLS